MKAKKIQEYLIHMIGGMTVEESQESDSNSHDIGKVATLLDIKDEMDAMYGAPADEWAKRIYAYVNNKIDNIVKPNKDNKK